MKSKLIFFFLFGLLPIVALSYTGEIIKSFGIPGSFPTGLTYDGQYLWLADYQTDMIYCIDPETGKEIKSIPSPGYWPEGLAWGMGSSWQPARTRHSPAKTTSSPTPRAFDFLFVYCICRPFILFLYDISASSAPKLSLVLRDFADCCFADER